MIDEDQLFAHIEQLERKIGALTGLYETTRQRVKQLEADKEKLTERLKKQQDQARQSEENQVESEKKWSKSKDFSKLVQDNLSGTDTNAALKQQLDAYIRELERCIAHLSSLS